MLTTLKIGPSFVYRCIYFRYFATLEDLFQSGHIFILNPDMLQYLTLHDLINIVKSQEKMIPWKREDENERFIIFPEEHMSSKSFEELGSNRNMILPEKGKVIIHKC